MADSPDDRGARDRARINVNQPHELSYWSRKLGITEDELRSAVRQAGPMVADVQRHLGRAA